jgi:hypothetical protein
MNHLQATGILLISFSACTVGQNEEPSIIPGRQTVEASPIVTTGNTIETRFQVPPQYERIKVETNSFGYYLRKLPLKPKGNLVRYYDGRIKHKIVHEAVIDISVGKKDLQQCADAVMRLRAEYFYSKKQFDSICFTLTNGTNIPFSRWIRGDRIIVKANNTNWRHSAKPSDNYDTFIEYLDFIFTYAGTISLARTMSPTDVKHMKIGDVFIVGGSPGHAVIVVDMARDTAGKKIFMLAQSYMPAQDIHVLKNLNDVSMSPWYYLKQGEVLVTPEWTFTAEQLRTW